MSIKAIWHTPRCFQHVFCHLKQQVYFKTQASDVSGAFWPQGSVFTDVTTRTPWATILPQILLFDFFYNMRNSIKLWQTAKNNHHWRGTGTSPGFALTHQSAITRQDTIYQFTNPGPFANHRQRCNAKFSACKISVVYKDCTATFNTQQVLKNT